MKILLVDDHALFIEGLRHVLKALGSPVEIVEAVDARRALKILHEQDDLDLILLDLALPDARPFEVLQASRRLQPQVPVVVLSATEERFEVESALRSGAQAYVFKSSPSQVLLDALRRVMRGEVVVPKLGDDRAWESDLPSRLTERQIEVLRMLARGLSNKEIADNLAVAENTVKVHLAAIYRTLGVASRTSAVLKALHSGLLTNDP
jgi:DNA-binding NarL/FixJ family response regulator